MTTADIGLIGLAVMGSNLALNIAEILCDGQTRQRHTSAGTRRFVHLAEHQRNL